jgi:streptogramin lyase
MRVREHRWAWLGVVVALLSGCGDETDGNSGGGGSGGSGGSGGGGGILGSGGNFVKPIYPLYVANSEGDNVAMVDRETGEFYADIIPKGTSGLRAPDALAFDYEEYLYVSSGDDAASSAVLRVSLDLPSPEVSVFASGGGLLRPSGLAFGPDDMLYVSSYLTDQILRYDAKTGAFIDVFKTGDGQPGGLNGPRGLALDPVDYKLYVATEGSVAVAGKATYPGLPSQVLQIDMQTGDMKVFADQPLPSPEGPGYVRLLGLAFGPDCFDLDESKCELFVSDYANDIRRFDRVTGALKSTISTNYSGVTPSGNSIGGLSFDNHGRLFTVGFNADEATGHPGAVLRFDGATSAPLPGMGQTGAVLVPENKRLLRPIGVLAL